MKTFNLACCLMMLCCLVSPMAAVGMGGVVAKAVIVAVKPKQSPTVQNKGYRTSEVKSIEFVTPVYKDYYSKTLVDIRQPVSTVLYQDTEFSVVLNDTNEYVTVENVEKYMSTTVYLQPSMLQEATLSRDYNEFEWATETQTITGALNSTITTVIDNGIPFL